MFLLIILIITLWVFDFNTYILGVVLVIIAVQYASSQLYLAKKLTEVQKQQLKVINFGL